MRRARGSCKVFAKEVQQTSASPHATPVPVGRASWWAERLGGPSVPRGCRLPARATSFPCRRCPSRGASSNRVIVGEVDGRRTSHTRRNRPVLGGTSVPACVPSGLKLDTLSITLAGVSAGIGLPRHECKTELETNVSVKEIIDCYDVIPRSAVDLIGFFYVLSETASHLRDKGSRIRAYSAVRANKLH